MGMVVTTEKEAKYRQQMQQRIDRNRSRSSRTVSYKYGTRDPAEPC